MLAPPSTQSRRDLLVALALSLITFAVYAQVRRFDFIPVDDPQYVQANDRVLQGLSWSNVQWAFAASRMANWHPLTWLSHMLDSHLFGPAPAGPHLVNAGLHALNAALAYVALVLLTGMRVRSAIVAAFFALHPLRIESVAWIAERKDVLCALFFLLAIIAYAQYVKQQSRGWYAGVIVAMALGAMAKPTIVTLPCVLLLLDFWPLHRIERPAKLPAKLIVEKLPLFALALASSVVTYLVQRTGGAMSAADASIPMRIANAALAYGSYIRKTLWPSDLAAFYPYHGLVVGTTFPWIRALLAAVVLIGVTALAIAAWRRGNRAVLIGWLWFLGVLVPSIGLVQVGLQSMADRYTYLPHIGLLIAIVWGFGALVERSSEFRQAAVALAGVAIIVLACSTAYQLRYWANGYTLFRHALDVTDHNPGANMSVAIWLTTHGRGDEAIPYYLETLRLQPNIADAHNNVGNFLRERRDLAGAQRHLQTAVAMSPGNAEAHHNLANVLGDLGRLDDAKLEYERAIALDPDQAQFHYNYGLLLAAAGRMNESLPRFGRALQLRPRYIDARFALALALLETGKRDAAKTQFEQVMSLRPDWTDAMGRFAWILATTPQEQNRDPAGAVQLANHANKLTRYENPQLLDALAAALAAAGKFDQAIPVATRGRDLATAHGQTAQADRINARLKLYQSGKPFIATTQPTTAPSTTRAPSATPATPRPSAPATTSSTSPGTPGEAG